MVKKKSASKRLTLHKKYKIARKVREHKRQERKQQKLRANAKPKKDPGIPNNWPFKEELLRRVEQERLDEIERQKQAAQQRKDEKKRRKQQELQERKAVNAVPVLTPQTIELQSRMELKESVQTADLVLVVLDARDPQGSRSLSLEDGLIAKGGKKVALVLNKIDLVPTETAKKWVKYLRRFHPTIPVRAVNERVADSKKPSRTLKGQQALYARTQQVAELRDNGCVDALRYFLEQFGNKAEAPVRVALVGYPNVGKSTLLNAIKRRFVAEVASTPKTTRHKQEVQYNDKVVLVDCPPLDPEYSDPTSIILRHSIANVWLDDPATAITDLFPRCNAVNLMQSFQIPMFKSHEDFLKKLAVKKNVVRKGGDPDVLQAARVFLRDLASGASCLPPSKSQSRFELPEWFIQLDLEKLDALETTLFVTNPQNSKRVITFSATSSAHAAGDTTEYDLVLGQLPECDGLTSDEEEQEDDEDGDEDEDMADEQEEEDGEDEEDDDDDMTS